MTISVVGARYARALVDAVCAPGAGLKPDEATAQLRSVDKLLASSPELRAALVTPAIQSSVKKSILAKFAAELGLAPLIRNFVFVLVDHKRIAKLPEIRESFEQLMDERLGFVQAEVASAAPLDQAESKALESELANLSGKQVRMRFTVDPALVGGAAARLGSTVYDGSIRGQLERMRRQFTGESADFKMGN